MKRTFIGFALAAILATSVPAFAKDSLLTACTADQKAVSVSVTLNDDLVTPQLEAEIGNVFKDAAASMPVDAFLAVPGAQAFFNRLSKEAYDAITIVKDAPKVTGICKVA